MSDWPDPDKPGWPLNPERDGWHWIVGWSDKLFVAEWDSDQKDYVWFDGGDAPLGMVENGWTYAGPVLMPAEADALRAENARLREALDTIGFAPSGWGGPDLNECILIARKALEVKP
jgi:hypothetical protein